MKLDFERLRKNRFLKWVITLMAAYKLIAFLFFFQCQQFGVNLFL